jgi:hypothetical protein
MKGEIIAASEVAAKAVPICVALKPSPFIQVPMDTPHAPQTKNWKKNRIEIWRRAFGGIVGCVVFPVYLTLWTEGVGEENPGAAPPANQYSPILRQIATREVF